jgi:hypothetical protein
MAMDKNFHPSPFRVYYFNEEISGITMKINNLHKLFWLLFLPGDAGPAARRTRTAQGEARPSL